MLFHTHVNHSSQGQLKVLNGSEIRAGLKGLPGPSLLGFVGVFLSFLHAHQRCLEWGIKKTKGKRNPVGVPPLELNFGGV